MIAVFLIGIATIVSLLLDLPAWVFAIINMAALIEAWWATKLMEVSVEEFEVLLDETTSIVHNSLQKTETWYKYLNSTADKFTPEEIEYFHLFTEEELETLYYLVKTLQKVEEVVEEESEDE